MHYNIVQIEGPTIWLRDKDLTHKFLNETITFQTPDRISTIQFITTSAT